MSKSCIQAPRLHLLPVFVLVVSGVLASLLCFLGLRALEVENTRAVFRRVAQQSMDNLQAELDLAVSKVVALGAFCDSGNPITRSSFDAFVTPLRLTQDAGIQALEWAPYVPGTERAAFERAARRNGAAGFEIRDRGAAGTPVPASARPFYYPVLYAQPMAGNESAIGFDDLSGNSIRKRVLSQAAATGELTASSRVSLVQEDAANQAGIIIVRPVFLRTDSRRSASGGRGALLGFAEGVVRLGDVVEKHGTFSGVGLSITDLSEAGQRLYPREGKQTLPDSQNAEERTITVGGRNWRIAASPMPGAFPVYYTYSYAGCVLCLLLTFLAAVQLSDLLDRGRQVERLVEERSSALNAAVASLAELHRGLEESEVRYRRLVETSPDAIVVQRQGGIIVANPVALEMFGFASDHVLEGRSLSEFAAPEGRALAEALIREASSRAMHIPTQQLRVLRRDGQALDVEFAASSFLQDGGMNIQVVLRDITRRKQQEVETARFIRAIEQVRDSIVITDAEANIVYVNPAFERISGYSLAEVLGKNPRFLQSGRQTREFYRQMWEALASGEAWTGRYTNRAKDGRLFLEEATISPVLGRGGGLVNYVAVKRDITLEAQLQEQMHHSQKMDAIGRLSGGVAHDFNNMLMVIISYAELIAHSLPEGDPLSGHVMQILRAAQRSSALTRQLLAFSRKQVLAPQILDCNGLIVETSSMIRRLISENIDLHCDLTPDLWPVKADADQMVQVILNLCVNSRDAMPDGGSIVIATRNRPADPDVVEISVSDTGVGIPRELQERLFEPFFTTKERGKGTGLGLATVYGIVQQSGGHVRVESSPGHGATFFVCLPRCRECAPAAESPAARSNAAVAGRVLVAEDEHSLREAIADQLRDRGYQVLEASDGIEALELISRHPDLSVLICDLIMPRMGGRELARLAAEQLPTLSCIYMSGHADQNLDEADQISGRGIFLQKPFTMNALLSRIDELHRRAAFLSATPPLPGGPELRA